MTEVAGRPVGDERATPAAWSTVREMEPLETVMWRAEADPRLRSTVTVVDVLDCVPDWPRLVAAHDWASRVVPRFRQRVVEPALGLGNPVWATDPELDLAYHLRRMRLPAPGSMRQLLDVAQGMAMSPFDRARPLWEAMLVEGLDGDKAGYILKSHHSVTDGIGGMQLLALLHSRTREPMVDRPEPPAPPKDAPTAVGEAARQLVRRLGQAPLWAGRRSLRNAELAGRALTHPRDAVTSAVDFGRSMWRVAAPPPCPPSPLLSGRSLSWRFEALEVPFADLRAAGKAAGGSLNDAYLAAVLGGFRLYHERMGSPVDAMPMAIPISLRTGDDPLGGNRFAGARFAAPVGEPDPAERIRRVREFVLSARAEPAIDAMGLLAPGLSQLPAPLLARASGSFTSTNDVQASNVPGIPHPVYLAGARIERMYPFGPLPGCAAMVVLLSHNGTCCIGVNVDPAAVTDVPLLAQCLRDGFDEVLALAPDSG